MMVLVSLKNLKNKKQNALAGLRTIINCLSINTIDSQSCFPPI